MTSEQTKYFLYARKSTESEDRQMASIPDQIDEMQRIAEKMGLQVIEIISESKTAKQPGRKAFNEMVQRIHNGEANGILCWKLNRLARNPVDGGQISWMLQQGVIQHIQTSNQGYKPTDPVLMMQLEFGMANQYVKDLSVDVKRGMRKKAERGWFPTATLPLGYKHNKDSKGQIVIEKEIAIEKRRYTKLKSLWKKMLKGNHSIASIKREGDKMGLKTRAGRLISYTTYERIFKNQFYCGYFLWNNEDGVPTLHKGKHTPMVSKKEFQRVQQLLQQQSQPTRLSTYHFPFKGSMKCGECGCGVTAEQKLRVTCPDCKHRYSIKQRKECPQCGLAVSDIERPMVLDKTYYHCTKKKGRCSQRSIESNDLEEQILAKLKEISVPAKFNDWVAKTIDYIKNEERDETKVIKNQLMKQETELKNRIDNLARMRADNEISKEQMVRLESETQEELVTIQGKIQELDLHTNDWATIIQECTSFATKAAEEFKNGSDIKKMAILKWLGSNHQIIGKKLYFTMRFPLEKIHSVYMTIRDQPTWFEPVKIIDNKGKSKEVLVPISIGRTGLELVRTTILKDKLLFFT